MTPNANLKEEQIIALNDSLTGQEEHFNQLQTNYRLMAAGWLAATFTGIGFMLEKNPSLGQLHPLFISGVIALMGSAGILLAWHLDLRVYHTLLDAVFISGLQLENEHPWLPQVRNNMMKLNNKRGVRRRLVLFYLLGWVLLTGVAGAFFILRLAHHEWLIQFSIVYFSVLTYITWKIYSSTNETSEQAQSIAAEPEETNADEKNAPE